MAKGPGPALLLAGAAALLLMSRKGKGDAKGNGGGDFEPDINEAKEKPQSGIPKAPKAKSQEELKEELEGEESGGASQEEIVAEAQWKVWPPGTDPSGSMNQHNILYATADCEAALIGRDWKPVIEFEGKLYDPAGFWKEFGEGEPPLKIVEQVGSSQVNWFARRLFQNKNAVIECAGEIPNPANYDTDVEYDNAWTAFLNGSPALAKLYYEVHSTHVREPMLAAWGDEDPEAYTEFQIEEFAEWAVQNYPNEDVTEQTDQAYFSYIDGVEGAPQVLDPDNPAHADYIELWLALNDAIKNL